MATSGYFLQTTFGSAGNFEMVLPSPQGGLVHVWRNNDTAGFPWMPPTFFASGYLDGVSLIQRSGLETNTLRGYIGGMREDIKVSLQKRLGRIEGQVRGLSRMVDEDRYCIDIVTQISAVRAALRRVEEEVLRDHVAHCVEHAIASGNKTDQREKIAELMAVIGRSDR